jgi:hypothetical protein
MPDNNWKKNLSKARYVMDALLLVGFVLVCVPQTTGLAIHEWGSLLFIIPLVIHILLHWDWIKTLPQNFARRLNTKSRFNAIWDFIFYLAMLMVTISGFLISVVMFPQLNIPLEITPFWSEIHHDLSNLLLPMLGIHLALHWDWITAMTKKMFKRQ